MNYSSNSLIKVMFAQVVKVHHSYESFCQTERVSVCKNVSVCTVGVFVCLAGWRSRRWSGCPRLRLWPNILPRLMLSQHRRDDLIFHPVQINTRLWNRIEGMALKLGLLPLEYFVYCFWLLKLVQHFPKCDCILPQLGISSTAPHNLILCQPNVDCVGAFK